jgi:hypothetical protein
MSVDMTHDDVRAALAAEALGALDGAEADAVRAHLASCAGCRAELDGLRAAAASLAFAAPPAPLDEARSARLRARRLARAAADRADAAVDDRSVIPLSRAPSARRRAGAGWLAAAAALLLFVLAGGYAARTKGRYDGLSESYARLDAEHQRMAAALARRDSMLAALSGPGVKVIDLASTQKRAPSGRMFWDPRTARWTFFAHDLPPLRSGRDYQLWLITPAGPVSAGTFRPSPEGQALVQATYPLAPDSLKAVAVTEEPAGGLPKPSGTPLILGTYGE